MLQDYYAERLHRVHILHVNWIFRQINSLIKPFISARSAEKVNHSMWFISQMNIIKAIPDLKEYFTEENLLKEHQGTSDYTYKYPANDE